MMKDTLTVTLEGLSYVCDSHYGFTPACKVAAPLHRTGLPVQLGQRSPGDLGSCSLLKT